MFLKVKIIWKSIDKIPKVSYDLQFFFVFFCKKYFYIEYQINLKAFCTEKLSNFQIQIFFTKLILIFTMYICPTINCSIFLILSYKPFMFV